ncbi:MAG TPA: four helix bundle protein [Pirellulaceae bacterium]|nr:four helix bundle protein [Planctomycetaceae bacterium]HRX78864.1 four helix bundle protein [Pirellulaceae bacterium]
MDSDQLRRRTKEFARRIVKLVAALPNDRRGDVIGSQVLKSGTSIGANYREALRASSKKHFISILQIVLREADETHYWLEILSESGIVKAEQLKDLTDECYQLIAIFASTIKTAKSGPEILNLKS